MLYVHCFLFVPYKQFAVWVVKFFFGFFLKFGVQIFTNSVFI